MEYNRNMFTGYKLIEDPNAVKQVGTREEPRSFTARFFSWPWRPWQLTTSVPVYEPDDNFVVTDDSIIGHPDLIRALRESHQMEEDHV